MFFSSLTLTIYLTYATACSTTIPLSDNMTSERINKPEINKDNIQGNIWPGVPKLHEFFLFFNITSERRFRRDLKRLIPLVTTANDAVKFNEQIRQNKTEVSSGEAKSEVIPLTGVNLAFSAKGLKKVRPAIPSTGLRWLDGTAPKHHLTTDQLSARLMGRWKSGAPTFLTPCKDDPSLADCNNFDFQPGNSQEKCPFAAHIRKCRPRGDVKDTSTSSMMRRGIPYGDEVTKEENDEQITKKERGMFFLCYQSNIANGFRRVQEQWCNKNTFPPLKRGITGPPGPGADPICGQSNGPDPFVMGLCDGQNNNIHVDLKSCVIPKGGEYFFSPSIKALTNIAKQ
ncbi:Dyp-type peroxidase family protein [Aspergillus fumigatus A1163]|uniref:Dyp-type peroxidase family protein n=1 Tax=Aspergillus fumigatus (strain CBS 144.89 / FGSC A1163 / CEA10) TaxID=451804 RepID=B0YBD7_ASPFC|nr:Dyp-type peroxidase family protein [Aspergillus fumigatus A1163]